MHLTPREVDKLLIFSAGELARKRRARGLKLNHPEAVALITSEILELIRDGRSLAEIMARDAKLMRGGRPFLFTNLKRAEGLPDVVSWIQRELLYEDRGIG